MKTVFTILGILITTISFGQSQNLKEPLLEQGIHINNLEISVTVDSAEEVESSFTLNDIKEVLKSIDENQKMSFEIICTEDVMSNGEKSKLSFKVDGNSSDVEAFEKSIEKIKNMANKFYQNK